ncbi:MAG: YetF domain-containing protein [Litorimonas sp.]
MTGTLDWSAPFFDGWQSLFNVAVGAAILYPLLVVLIRLAGKRSVSKMNNFDWIVTVAVGSVIASGIVFDSVTVTDAILGTALLLGLQRVLTQWMAGSGSATRAIVSTPTLMLHEGRMLRDAMRRERISEEEIHSALRASGFSDPAAAYAVVLESNAELTVIPREAGDGPALRDVPALSEPS